ncbi:LOW QUALITY PROTEIN: hypothetical protein U9M48_036000 [Paspalum notatum var. saurae]|uniref:Integrase catalytic domain-containing protein n=1 Tax=Paspalum notatum var. saurae TaxID=547442 RepID=A0AAQ3X9K9_PASNO
MHPGSNKMYQDLKQRFWWTRMKREIAKYVSECHVCKRVKADHLKPAGMLHPLNIPAWKWEDIHMDFVVGLPRTQKGYDSIWVIIDRFTKSAHFLPVKTVYRANTYAELYIAKIVSLHGVPRTITSDRGSVFVSRFWEQLQNALGTKLIHSSAYHPQTSGQVERVNQIVEDMLRACALTYSTKWDECLPLAEFAYNNSYQKSLEMAPFEALYGRRCRTPLNWSEPGERVTFGPDLVTQAEEQVRFIQENLKRAQSRQKSYSDRRRRPLVFKEGDHVYLRVSPMKGVHRFGVKGKLAPRYVGPFKISEKCGPVAYRLELPPRLAAVHDIFHVSQLKKCSRVPRKRSTHPIEPDLTYEARPVKVLDRKQRSTRRSTVTMYKVQWSEHTEEEATWETEEYLRTNSHLHVHPTPGQQQDVPRFKAKILVDRMKREIAKYVSECDVCQRVKADHLKPAGMLQPLASSRPEVGGYTHGLHCRIASHTKGFAYNNSYQKSLDMAPFEALYGRRCRTPLNRSEPVSVGHNLGEKSYSDKRRRPLTFEEDDHVYLRVSPMKGVHRFGVKGKLAPRYVVIDTSQIRIQPDLTYEEKPIKILDQKQRSTRRRTINFYKVQWSNHSEEEATWEQEEFLRTKYPGFLPSTSN